MDYYHLTIPFSILLLLLQRGTGANIFDAAVPCYLGDNGNATLQQTIHLSDVVLAGRIWSEEEGKFGTHNAVVSYYIAYKSDRLLRRIALSRTKVINFPDAPNVGQLGLYFLFRDPSLQLALFCMTSLSAMKEYYTGLSSEAIIKHITEVIANDSVRTAAKASDVPYPDPCDTDVCGGGAYCSTGNTLPQSTVRCACYTGFFRNHTTGLCQPRTTAAAVSQCPQCGHAATCHAPPTIQQTGLAWTVQPQCSCEDFVWCSITLQERLCGSDGREYAGLCEVRREACQQQKDIHPLYSGSCLEDVPEPCLGTGDPLSTSAGLVPCEHCPAQYFCHSTSHYGVCCPVGVSSAPTPSAATPTPLTAATPTSGPEPTKAPTDNAGCGSGSGDSDGSGSGGSASGDDDTESGDSSC